ncbi:aspartate aminotransferase family protein [Venenivibrio stagnispumantis]|uniref:Acetylornithine aminotransferase n=1 Tax=Venenivibrio stagnispumantis TaxID=407998 RepID=A0AA45WM66_9AQUI|nr:aspartate aminotransferase family protein [Venenivibrio stagnispumantis]MCW4572815.1 aspartate aminotransferase family protein [Venenivibrio stagnispumantis]SMP13709.1 acetylornithine aminotransferase/acetylornithine/N-succinyldiaminopimelate aminotransferase [Venenivibrio stagnispumantis]
MDYIAEAQKYLFQNYTRFPISFEKGEGVYLYDENGKRYLDLLSGIAVNILGYNHPKLTQAICEQSKKIIHISNLFHIKPQIEVAKILVQNSCGDKVFFCNSGAESNEAAIKLARRYFYDKKEKRYEIITFEGSFHGRTLATVTATAQPKYHEGFEPLPEGFKYAKFNDIDSVKELILEKTAGIMIELIQGEGGVNPADKNFIKELYNLTREKGLLFIVDEVQTGIGRTGKLFAYQHYDIEPDIITLAKGLGGGVPIGAVIAKEDIAKSFIPGTHASTFGGNYLATTAAKVVLEEVLKDNFLNEVLEKGEFFKEKLKEIGLSAKGIGLMIGVDMPENIDSKEIVKKALQNGLIIGTAGKNTLRFVPPLIITKEEIEEAIKILKNCL